jgi:hypothetical protein
MANIDISPERKRLQLKYADLKRSFAALTEKQEHMNQFEGPNLCSLYLDLIGRLQYERLTLQIECKTLQMRQQLMQAYINRNEEPDLEAVERQIQGAVTEYNKILAEEAERLKAAREVLNAPLMSEEESKEMKDLYKFLVKQLHPDLHPNQTERESDLFLQVQVAYKLCDIDKLREIALLLDSKELDKTDLTESYDELQRKVKLIEDKIKDIREKIDKMLDLFPFIYREKLYDKEWVKEQQEIVKQEIENLKETKNKLERIVVVMQEYKK